MVLGSAHRRRRPSTPPRSPRTGSGCWITRSRIGSSPRSSARPSCAATSPVITSRWTAPCWRPGPRTRASGPGTARVRDRPRVVVTPRPTSGAGVAATRPMCPAPTRRLGWPASPTGWRPSSATPGICSWSIATRGPVDVESTEANGFADTRTPALDLLQRLPPRKRRRTVAADQGL